MDDYIAASLLLNEVADLLESSSSDDSSESSDGEEPSNFLVSFIDAHIAQASKAPHSQKRSYLQVIRSYSDLDFSNYFRVNRSTFAVLIDYLSQIGFRSSVIFHGGNYPLEIDEMLYITLQFLGSQGPIRLLANTFGRTESTILFAVEKITTCLFENQSQFIKWPAVDEISSIETKFKSISGVPGAVGYICGSHIQIRPPSKDHNAFQNHKKFHSIVLMGVVLPDKRFSYIFTGYPGSKDNSYIFQQSELYDRLNSKDCGGLLDSKKYHIVGDSSFPLKEWLLTPYKHTEDKLGHRKFNTAVLHTKLAMEEANCDVKNRFQRLLDIHASIEKCVKYVVASCVIHNISIENEDVCNNRDVNVLSGCDVNPPLNSLPLSKCGVEKRDNLSKML